MVITFDDDQMSGEIDAPGQGGRSDEHLNLLVDKEFLDDPAILLGESGVMDAHTERQRQLQVGIADAGSQLFHVSFGQVHKLARILLP